MRTKNKISRIGGLKKVETIEEFRDILLKILVSNQEKRKIFIKPIIGDGRPYFYPVDNISSFQDISKLFCLVSTKIIDKKFTELNGWGLTNDEILNLEFV
jgi:hypothetical protein